MLGADFDSDQFGVESVVRLEESERSIELSVTFPAIYFSDDSHEVNEKRINFKQVNIDGVGYLVEGGKPLLPSFQRYLQIPDNCTYEVKVSKCEPVELEDIEVFPAQDNISDGANDVHEFEYDEPFIMKRRNTQVSLSR